jgi:hypothetical protein
MRNTRWLRFGLASSIAVSAGLGLTIVACGDDDVDPGPGTITPTPETSTPETSIPDTGTADTSKPDAGTLAKLTLVNATTDMGPNMALNARGDAAIRVCFRQGTTQANIAVAGFPPLPENASATAPAGSPPGIFYGTGGTFPSFGLDLEPRLVQPIVMNAKSLFVKGITGSGVGKSCDELIGPTADAAAGLMPNVDYWELPVIELGTFKKEKAYVLVLTGCTGDATIDNKDKCGANPPAGGTPGLGNLAVKVIETTRTPVSATELGVQFLYASTQANAIFGPAGANYPIEPGFMANPADAASFQPATAEGGVPVLTLTPAKAVTGATPTDTTFFVSSKSQPNPLLGPLGPFPVGTIRTISGLPAAAVLEAGKNYVFINLGDTAEPTFAAMDSGAPGDGGDGTTFNTKSYHYLAFPTDPTVVPYTP